jgi:hypothetical protein
LYTDKLGMKLFTGLSRQGGPAARSGGRFPRFNWRFLAVVFVCLSALTSARGQETLSADETKQLTTLQANLSDWQKTLASMDFSSTGLDHNWVDRLNQERDMCLETIESASKGTAFLVKEPTLTREFLVTESMTRLEANLGSLLDLVALSYWPFPPGSGNQVLSMDFQREVSPMLSGAESAWENLQYELVNRLNAIDKSGAPQVKPSAAPKSNGQISGHVYRADNDSPLSRIIVTLDPSGQGIKQSERTAKDGSYRFSDLAPGNYWVTAYGTGFVGSIYRSTKSTSTSNNMVSSCPPDCVSVASGQKIIAVDFRLTPDPLISSLDEQLANLFPGESDHISPGVGRFSPEGKYFAISLGERTSRGVFLYDLASKTLQKVADNGFELAWGADDMLYIKGSDYSAGAGSMDFYLTATISGTNVAVRTITDFPDAINTAFRQELNGANESNDEYVVTAARLCRGCPDTLAAKRTDGSGEQVIAGINSNFIFDRENSIVFYPDGNEIVLYNLATKKSQKTALPVEALDLVDQTQEGGGHLVAYYANAPCEPNAASEEAESELLVPGNVNPRRDQAPATHMCFVKLP